MSHPRSGLAALLSVSITLVLPGCGSKGIGIHEDGGTNDAYADALISTDGGEDAGSCDCTGGVCCDGCHFLSATELCDITPVESDWRCSGWECGDDAERRLRFRYCTGQGGECTNENLVWGAWERLEDCGVSALCRSDSEAAWCVDCTGGCADQQCCTDDDGDGRGTSCDLGADACDDDPHNWTASGCATCTDSDGDGYRGTGCDQSDDCDDQARGVTGPCLGTGCPAGWVLVPAGAFHMGCNAGELGNVCDIDERPRHVVTLSAFCIEETEVAVGAYRACAVAFVCEGAPGTVAAHPWNNWSPSAGAREDQPLSAVTWAEAREYCQEWMGGDLPTEAEWEKAARGTDQRKYPWGEDAPVDCTRCNWDYTSLDPPYGCLDVDTSTGPGTWEVGYLTTTGGDSPYGVKDMAGNVWEWVLDYYDASYYSSCSCTSGCSSDPLNDCSGTNRVIRGCSFTGDANCIRVVNRNGVDPATRSEVGFRCRRAPQ